MQICEILCYSLTSQKSCEKIHEILTIEQSPDKSLGLSQQQILQFVYDYFFSVSAETIVVLFARSYYK